MMQLRTLNENIEKHYGRPDLGTLILAALSKAVKDLDNLTAEDLAPIDEFHIRGRQATVELAHILDLNADMHILDIDCGIGGPSRLIAHEFGCRVTGIDLTDEYCRAASMIAERLGISHHVSYRQSDTLSLPFADGIFDVVWAQHAAMNIADKAPLYREAHRLLKRGGALAIYNVLSGPGGPIILPVPWASSSETNFTSAPEEMRNPLEKVGFKITIWEDATDAAKEVMTIVDDTIRQRGLPLPGTHVLLGPDFEIMARNLNQNLRERRLALAQIVARRQ